MIYYFDTEFIEGHHKPLFGKSRHFIDLISIGIVAEDGRTYYAISNEYNYANADEWVKENVILPAYTDTVHGDDRNRYDVRNFHWQYGKTNKQIAYEIFRFIHVPVFKEWDDHISFFEEIIEKAYSNGEKTVHEFYGYYADYDWVLFCSLFGRMIDLPKGFPMYCRDLKQILDEKAEKLDWLYGRDVWSNANRSIYTIGTGASQDTDRPATLEEKIKTIKELSEYPTQQKAHNALDDAKWNKNLHEFLNNPSW